MNSLSQINYSLTACVGGLLCVLRGFDVGGLTVFLNFSRQFSVPSTRYPCRSAMYSQPWPEQSVYLR